MKDYNTEYNQTLYLLRESWCYLDSNKMTSLVLIGEKGDTIKSYYRRTPILNRDLIMTKIISSMYNLDAKIYGICINNQMFHRDDSNLKTDYNLKVIDLISKHTDYCISIKNVQHERGNLSFEQRLSESGVTGKHQISENCSKTWSQTNIQKDVVRILRAYFLNRNTSLHWASLQVRQFVFFTSCIKRDHATGYTYSVTIFSQSATDQ